VISRLAKRILLQHRKTSRRRLSPLLRGDAEDVYFRFPGNSSFATEVRGKDQCRVA
jgi:hypothetical protein